MNIEEYCSIARQTRSGLPVPKVYEDTIHAVLGLVGEAGEIADTIKKSAFQGHVMYREKVEEEIGDVMWYVAYLCDAMGFDIGSVLRKNIEKLARRYPAGHFTIEDSLRRVDHGDALAAMEADDAITKR